MIPESEEVAHEGKRRRYGLPSMRIDLQPIRDWVDNMDIEEAMKWYLGGLLVLLSIQTAVNVGAKIVKWCAAHHEEAE